MVFAIIFLIIGFLAPILVIKLKSKWKFINVIGVITVCYLIGLLLSFIPISAEGKDLLQTVAFVLIPISIPLILFKSNFFVAKKMMAKTFLSFLLLTICVVIVSVTLNFTLAEFIPEGSKVSAMISGLYTGGTPNVNAIGVATGAESETIVLANLSDMIVGGVYLCVLLTFAKPMFSFLLDKKRKDPQFVEEKKVAQHKDSETLNSLNVMASDYDFSNMPKTKKEIWQLIGAIAISIVAFGIGAVISLIFTDDMNILLACGLVSVTTFGIALSFVKPIRNIKGTFSVGQYLIMVFSVLIAMSINLWTIAVEMLPILGFFALAQISTVILHTICCKIFRIDSDTAILTSVAGIYGPAFITPVAEKIKNQELIIPTLICGIIGYAIGTYLGLGLYYFIFA